MKRKVLWAVGIGFGVLSLAAGAFYLKVELTYRRDFSSTPLPALHASEDPETIARGRYVVHALAHCSACHGPAERANERRLADDLDDLRGGYVMKAGPFGTFYPANLTPDAETGIGKLSDAELARVIRHGVSPGGQLDPLMSFAVGPMADEDLVGVISYLRSIKPVKNPTPKDEWGFVAKALSSKFAPNMSTAPAYVPAPANGGASTERGEYLANGPALCAGCHSPYDVAAGFELKGAKFSGEMEADPDPTDPAYEIAAPNLTPDPKAGVLASYTEDAFVDRFKKGGRAVKGSKMPWENFGRMTEDDLKSVYRYLSKVPPAPRLVGPSRRPKGSFKAG
jgi:mono/diheme cytochrome c family protein